MRAFNSQMWRIRRSQSMGFAPKFSDFALSACKFSVSHQILTLIVSFGGAPYQQTVNPLWIENQA
jgi:hypothetical protein